jgi:hypothetical protein
MRATCPPTRLFYPPRFYHYNNIIIGEDYNLSSACYMPRLSYPPFYHSNNITDEDCKLRSSVGSFLNHSVTSSLLGP